MCFRCLLACLLVGFLPLGAAEVSGARVALILDDGPDPAQNAAFLELFAREGVRVTFAHVGRNVKAHPHLAAAAAKAGHEIVNHSFTHPHFKQLDDAAIDREVRDTTAAIADASGAKPAWFWAPFGDWDARIEHAVRGAGLEHFPAHRFQFNDTRDWDQATDAAGFHERGARTIERDTIVLCHEWPKVTLAEMPRLIAALKRQNVRFVTFSELAK